MANSLDELLTRRTAERLAARVVPERATEFRQERKQAPEPARVAPLPVATEKEARHMPTQPAPSIGTGFTSRTAVRVNATVAARSAQENAQAAQTAAVYHQGMEKVSPLDKLLAQKMTENRNRPGPKLALGLTQGMERG